MKLCAFVPMASRAVVLLWASLSPLQAAAVVRSAGGKLRRGAVQHQQDLAVNSSSGNVKVSLPEEVDGLMHFLAEPPCEGKRQEWWVPPPPKGYDFEKLGNCFPTPEAFVAKCVQHCCGLVNGIDGSYTDIQLMTVLEHECMYSKEFPHVYTPAFERQRDCKSFAQDLTNARYESLKSGSTEGYQAFCTEYVTKKRIEGGLDPDPLGPNGGRGKLGAGSERGAGYRNAATSTLGMLFPIMVFLHIRLA